jgi:hypothetical protein
MKLPSLAKELACFLATLALFCALASLWFPSSGSGRPDGQGGYTSQLALGVLDVMHLHWSTSPDGFAFSLSYGGLLRLVATLACTAAVMRLLRNTRRWCRQPA